MDKSLEYNLMKTTSIIYLYNNQLYKGGATCFFCQNSNNDLFIVTNKHVFDGINKITLLLTTIQGAEYITLNLGGDIKKHKTYDLAVIPFTNIYNDIIKNNKFPQIVLINSSIIISNFSNFHAIEDIIMLGYPDSLINLNNNTPIVRKGITATSLFDNYNGQDLFITDIPTFWGSSGSPIFCITNGTELRLVGVNCSTFFHEISIYKNRNKKYYSQLIDKIKIPNDLGLAIKSNILLEMIEN